MDKRSAMRLVQETFENGFDKNRFSIFVRNLLGTFDDSKAFHARGYVKEKFKKSVEIIKTYERLGTYTDPEGNRLDLLVVYLEKDESLDRARTTQRNFVADYLKDRDAKEASLVAFIPPDNKDWRFSLVKMEYQLGKTQAGKLKTREILTPARRSSFLVGVNESSHTAQGQFFPILLNDEKRPTLHDLEEAFSVEVVTKEFYKKYFELFLNTNEALDTILAKDAKIKADFQEKNIDTTDFAKKLLGQIVFLYFLQKKGWFGVARDAVWGTGAKDFLRRLFEKTIAPYDNFFNDTLEPLFYEALAVERTDDFYSKFNCKIPFLNGGLFDPLGNYDWVHTDIRLPDELFSNSRKTKEGDTGDGILDVFDRYNFTVKEDEPLEREVAVDPEMLGKVFENLLEVKDRKSKGTYYTPREIVHYMCQESLINYLLTELNSSSDGGRMDSSEVELVSRNDIETLIRLGETAIEHDKVVLEHGEEKGRYTFKLPQSIRDNANILDEKLEKIRVCDPAVGSGAFLVGMMTEVIRVRSVLTNYLSDNGSSIYDFKRHTIQNCLYGVDIDPGAIEIAKLRLWLSLIVDEQDIKQIKPLPNLDYKIMQGNSLIELLSPELIKKGIDREKNNLIDKLNELKDSFFDAHTLKEKQSLRTQINKLILEIANYDKLKELVQNKNLLANLKSQKTLFSLMGENLDFSDVESRKIKKLEQKIGELEKIRDISPEDHFEWHLNFNEVFEEKGGFNVVIANPPYIGEKGNKEIFRAVRNANLKKYYLRKMDYFYFFFHLAIDTSTEKGSISFITTNYYLTADSAKNLRVDFKNRTVILSLINFNELSIFESARGQHNLVTMLKKYRDGDAYAKTCITKRKGYADQDSLQRILSFNDSQTEYYSVKQKNLYESDESYIRLAGISESSSDPVNIILNKLKQQGELLIEFADIRKGVITGCDKVTNRHINIYHLGNEYRKGEGIFILNKVEYSNLKELLTDFEKSRIKPWFKNSDLSSYFSKREEELYLIDISYPADRDLDLKKIPNLITHLKKYKVILENRKTTANGLDKVLKKGYWWPIESRRKIDFDGPKILVPQRSDTNEFAYNEIPWYASADVYFITQKDVSTDLKYLLALLNSKLYFLWLYHKGKRKGETLELYRTPLSEIPIKKFSEEEQKLFIDLVDNILAITKDDDYLDNVVKQAKVREYENQLDQLVYKLYGLTQEEIKIVEAKYEA